MGYEFINGTIYYYKVKSYLGEAVSNNFSNIISAKPEALDEYYVNVIDPAKIINIYGSAKYYIQIFPKENFNSSLLVNCQGLPASLSHKFYLNGQEMGTNLSNVILPAAIMLKVTAGSATLIDEHHFTLRTTNTSTGETLDKPLSLTVVPDNGYGIHAEVEEMLIRKGDAIKIYGSILPGIPEQQIELTLSNMEDPTYPKTKYVQTDQYGRFEDNEWIATLGIGSYELKASWVDENTTIHNSVTRNFVIEKGQSYISCVREADVVPSVGIDFTISGALQPAAIYPFNRITIRVTAPDETISDINLDQDAMGAFETTRNFFDQSGIWKFKAYWEGSSKYIGCESDYLVVAVDVDFGSAIILGGGYAEQGNTYWNVTKKLSVEAYRDFKAKGFSDDMILFMIHSQMVDVDYNDVEDDVVDVYPPTVTDFLDVIETQFVSVLNLDTPLFIYMQGHGTDDRRFKVLGSDEYVSGTQIGTALDQLQSAVECNVILILESCFSGNFIQDLSGPNRVILTSAGNERYNTDAKGRISFSRFLFSKLREGDNLKKAFEYARNQLVNVASPQLDYNGDGEADASDGLLALNIYLNGMLTWGIRPVIADKDIEVSPVLEEGTATSIEVKVTRGDVDIDRVWIQVIPPNADIKGGDQTITYPELELAYNAGADEYQGTLTGLTQAGLYKIVALAQDVEHEVSDPGSAYISVAGSIKHGDVNRDDNVTLADAILALKVACNLDAGGESVSPGADVNGDDKIGMAEVVYILQKVAGLR